MLYRTYLPAPDLRPYVKCYWILRSEQNPFPGAEPLIPDGSVELIFNLSAPYRRYAVEDAGAKELVKGSHVVGERTQPFLVEQLGTIDHVAVRFRPGGLYPFVRAPISELTNKAVPAELILGTEAEELEEQLFDMPGDGERVAMLDGMLRRRLASSDARETLTRAAARLMARTQGRIGVGELCALLDCDYKQLERGFLTVVGIRPKFYGRLVRFLAVFDALKTASAKSWLPVALDFDYYDQAHFTKEFKAFTGVPPSRFVARPTSITAMLTRSVRASATPVSNSYKTGMAPPGTLPLFPK